MRPALSSRRPVSACQWSDNMKSILGENFDQAIVKKEKQPQIAQTSRSTTRESQYTVQKRALNSSLKRQKELASKQIQRNYRVEQNQLHREFHPPKKETKAFSKRFHDYKVIEHVIDSRNDEYIQSAESLPNGRTIDLQRARRLPPDNTSFIRSTNRVFFWG